MGNHKELDPSQSPVADGAKARSSTPGSQAISLPKGGGAISGIGEKFSPDLFTGTGNFTIPIAISPGREGFQPQLELAYSTGNGNEPFGLGWQISIPRVTRKTEKGLPSYTDQDVFVMSGAEDLVPLSNQPDFPPLPGYTVTYYRPRTEGLFARIARCVKNNVNNDVHWRATTRENITSIYGRTESSRIADPENPNRIFEWLLEETYDAKGNHFLYEYAQENDFRSPKRNYSQTYIRRILYGNTPENLEAAKQTGQRRTCVNHKTHTSSEECHFVFEVLFDYGDLPVYPDIPFDAGSFPQKTKPSAWPSRQDSFSSFRSGFEIRTLRRCERILMLHHFKEGELEGAPLVRSTDFAYYVNKDTLLSFLQKVTVKGYRKNPKAPSEYRVAEMPPLELKYSEFIPQKQRYQSIKAVGDDMPPASFNNPDYTLVNLFGDGLPDILNTTPNGYYYWKNLGNGRFNCRNQLKGDTPPFSLSIANVALGDMGGDGLPDIIVQDHPLSGFYEATPTGGWKKFKKIPFPPSFSLSDPNVRLIDLTGDGLSDILMTTDRFFIWYRCRGEAGYEGPRYVPRQNNLADFPDIYFDDPSGRVRLADMTGDGLNDIVLVHDGRIDYWPNLGYGKFGQRMTMASTPRIGYSFDPRRLFMADLDGSGCADLVYVESGKVRFWLNQSGNGWSQEQFISGTPQVHDIASVQFADIFGTGTTTLLWSYDYSTYNRDSIKALDFCGGIKPYLLTEMNNNMGATTRAHYAPSTKFYLEDLEKRKPWATPLPFPVLVLDKSEVIDHISKTKLVTTYKYHHGYFDGREREFRGFGCVEQFDTEEFDTFLHSTLHEGEDADFGNNQECFHVPPVCKRTWFHTGIYFDENMPSANGSFYDQKDMMEAYRKEFYALDNNAFTLSIHAVEKGDTPHEAYRALRGSMLRSEVYALDGTDKEPHPYTVVENRYKVKQLQPKNGNNHAVYLASLKETLTYNYERNPDDPRIVIYKMHENLIHMLSWCQTLPLMDQIKKETSEPVIQNIFKLLFDGKKYYEIHQIYLTEALAREMDGAFTEILQLVERFDSKIKAGGHVDEQGRRETFERIEGIISPIRDSLQKQFRALLGVT